MADLDFCKLEVTIIHSLQPFTSMVDKFRNVAEISKYFQSSASTFDDVALYFRAELGLGIVNTKSEDFIIKMQFDNLQARCELKIVDSIEDASDTFIFKVWNFPENTILYAGDYLLFKYYWESDPNNYTSYHGVINTVDAKRTCADLQITVKGQLVHQNILYNWSVYDKYPKLQYYSDIKDFIENELKFDFTSMVHGFTDKTPLTTPIFTRGKSVGVIFEEVCKQATAGLLENDECLWKFVNGQTILFYKSSNLDGRLLNEYFKVEVLSIKYNDLLSYTMNTDQYCIETFGLPTIVAGIVFHIDAEEVPDYVTTESAYYIVNEVEHNITLSSGYTMKIYATKTQ